MEGKLEGRIKVTGRRGGRCKQARNDFRRKKKGYWNLKKEVLDRTLWRNRFWRGVRSCLRCR